STEAGYRLAWVEATRGDLDAAARWLERVGARPDPGPTPEIPLALERVARGDTAGAIALMSKAVWAHALDPGGHALMADLLLATHQLDGGTAEAYAARALAPREPSSWRRWGFVQAVHQRDLEAVRALERYLGLAGITEGDDPEVARVLGTLRRRIPGGDVAQAALRRL